MITKEGREGEKRTTKGKKVREYGPLNRELRGCFE